MVKIRMSRKGKRNSAFWHIVAVDENKKRDGAVLDKIGTYNPAAKSAKDKIKYDTELYTAWIKKGAQPSETVARLIKAAAK